MRSLLLLVTIVMLSGCSAMLLGGSGTYSEPDECEQNDEEENKREC